MTKEEYMAKEADINERIRNLRDELRIAQEEYVRSNSPIPVGTKVITDKGDTGVISRYILKWGKIRPVVLKIKKDGTISKFEIPFYHFETIQPIE